MYDPIELGRPLRRNDVVAETETGYWIPGRVVRRVDETHVEVIDTWKGRKVYPDERLAAFAYKGYVEGDPSQIERGSQTLRDRFPVFHRMPTLRKLKQMRADRDGTVWAADRRRLLRRPEPSIDDDPTEMKEAA